MLFGRRFMRNPLREVLRSQLVWKMTGLTYPTAVYATNGCIRTRSDYLDFCRSQMEPLLPFFPHDCTVLEFGSGLGGNLMAVSRLASVAFGLEVNQLYVRMASRIAQSLGKTNVTFQTYDGRILPKFPFTLDLIFSIGVFERLRHDEVANYITQLKTLLRPGGVTLLYFLSAQAAETTFVRRLGADAYSSWDKDEVRSLLKSCGIEVRSTIPWGLYPRLRGTGSLPVAEMYVGVKRGS